MRTSHHFAGGERRGNCCGYTLLEIMIVAALIVTAGAFAVGNLREQMPAYRLDRATSQLVTDLSSARMRAISQALPARVELSAGARTYGIWVDANTNGVADTGEREERSLAEVAGLTIKASTASLTFSPQGRMPAVHMYWIASLNIKEAGTHTVYVLPSGQVRVTRKQMDWTPDEEK